MSVPVIAFFNNKGGVGKTSLAYHLAWMYADLGFQVVATDLDPQANLTSAFLDEDRLEELWNDNHYAYTIFDSIKPLIEGIGDVVKDPHLEEIDDRLGLLVGDLALSGFEDELSTVWPLCLERDRNQRAFRVMSAFWRTMQNAAHNFQADIILVDLGPNLGAINRAALIAADYVIIPLAPDLFSLQGLRNLGPTLVRWRKDWTDRLDRKPNINIDFPQGKMKSIGYIILQHSVRLNRPVKAYERWIAQIPKVYRNDVLGKKWKKKVTVTTDRHCLGMVKHYHSLVPMAQEVRKPLFYLKPADGAIGAHLHAVQKAYDDFKELARIIAKKIDIQKQDRY